jgi:hypothetical protein
MGVVTIGGAESVKKFPVSTMTTADVEGSTAEPKRNPLVAMHSPPSSWLLMM